MSVAATVSAPPSGLIRIMVTICTIAACIMQALDQTIANVALPYMQGNLSASIDQVNWVLTSYIIASAVMTAPTGWLANRFGRKRLFLLFITGFTASSFLCGFAQNIEQLVHFRILQGCFGAALVPLSQSIMLDLYPIEQRGTAMAVWATGVMIGPILGPTLGGYLTDVYDWRWVFFINVPFGIVAIAGLVLFLKEQHRDVTLRFDWLGFGVLGLALGAFQLMLDRGSSQDWFHSNEIIIEAALGGLGLYLFIVHMLTAEKPFIPPRLFRDASFISNFLMMFAVGIVLLASAALLPPYLQTLGGHSVAETGLLMTPRGIGAMLVMILASRLTKFIDPRLLMAAGIALIAISMWDMTHWTPEIGVFRLAMVTALQGAGISFVFIPSQVVGFATLPPHLRTDAAALYSLSRNIGSAIGVSISSAVLAASVQTLHAQFAEQVTPFNRALQYGAQGLYLGPQTPFGYTAIEGAVQHQAVMAAYTNDFMLMFWVCLPMLPLLFFMRKPRAAAGPKPELALE
jgi:DHA2 family multidrug resistance protein